MDAFCVMHSLKRTQSRYRAKMRGRIARLKLYAWTLLSPEPTGAASALLMSGSRLPFGQKGLMPGGNWMAGEVVGH